MKKHIVLFLLASLCALHAQPTPGVPETTTAHSTGAEHTWTESQADSLTHVNTTAWQDTVHMTPATFGIGKPVTIYPAVHFESELNWRGKKLATQTFIPKIGTETYLFGGQAYLDFNWLLPVESQYAKAFNTYMGWCYQITTLLNVDIGGNLFFYDKPVYGAGQTGFGSKDTSDVHIGFSLDTLLNPWAWITYDFVLDQVLIEGGVSHHEPLGPWIGAHDWAVEAAITGGWLRATRYGSREKINGEYWYNSYAYLMARADLVYKPMDDLAVSVGVRWSCNNDGSGYASNGLWLGPDNSVWFGMRVVYRFGF